MIDLQVLGPIRAVGAGGEAKIGGPRQQRLLAALVANVNTVVSTDQLMDLIWEGDPPDGAARSFKTYVARLRGSLGAVDAADLVVTHPNGYALEVDRLGVDAYRFEQLVERARANITLGEGEVATRLCEEALALWRGTAFGDFSAEPWAEAWVARLEESRAVAEELAIEAHVMAGRRGDLLPRIDGLVARYPYRDQLRGHQMLTLYRSGRQVDALRVYQEYRAMLAEDVGVEPGPALVELERRILSQDADLLAEGPMHRKLRDYELGERVGADDVAVVYRGFQPSVGREVAVKVIRPELADRHEFIRRFEAEAQAMAAVQHPHMVPIHDFWREPGGAYLVMGWLDGGSLQQRIDADGPLTPDDAVKVISEVGGALMLSGGAARAVRPGNVMFDRAGNAYVTALGLDMHRNDGGIGVEPSARPYVAPESLRDGTANDRSEVFTLGAILHTALLGTEPTGASEGWSDDATPFPALDTVIRRACAREPDRRFRDVAELLIAAQGAIDPSGMSSLPTRERLVAEELERINPYKGLRAFDEGDSPEFFGRAALVEELSNHVAESPLVCVVGPSGAGKSSVVRAGLVPQLRGQGFYVAMMMPGARPFEELERALVRLSSQGDPTLLARLTSGPAGITDAIGRSLPDGGRVVLVIDQFEELFTITDVDRRRRFLAALAHVVAESPANIRVVLTLRADFYDRPLLDRSIGPAIRTNTVAVTPLEPDELEAAVTGPAGRRGVTFEPALVAELVADGAANPGNLPLLQYALTELYASRTNGVITAAIYHGLGGMAGTLAARADGLYEQLGEEHCAAVRRLFTRLVTPGEGVEDTRHRALVSELAGVPPTVLDVYAKARLLTFDRDPVSREPTVEVAHEALIRAWPRLREWVDEDREDLRIASHLDAAARAWEEGGRPEDDLYRGARLAGAQEYRFDREADLGTRAREFLDASTEVADAESRMLRRSRRRLRGLLVALAVALVVAVTAASVAVARNRAASDRAREAERASLLSASASLRDTDLATSTLLALEANRMRHDAETSEALLSSLIRAPGRIASVRPGGAAVVGMALSGDRAHAAVGNGEGGQLYDLHTLEPVGVPFVGADVGHVSVSPSGASLSLVRIPRGQNSGPVTIYDTTSGTESPGVPGLAWYAVQSPVGDGLVTVGGHAATLRGATTLWPADRSSAEATILNSLFYGYSGDGRSGILWAESRGALEVISMDDPEAPARFTVPQRAQPLDAQLDERGETLVVRQSGLLQAHDVTTGEQLFSLQLDEQSGTPSGALAISDSAIVAYVERSGEVQLVDLGGEAVGRPLSVAPGPGGISLGFRDDGVLVTAGQELTLWDVGDRAAAGSIVVPGDFGARFDPNGATLAVTDRSGGLVFADIERGGEVVAAGQIARNGAPAAFTPMEFSADGSLLVTVGGSGSSNLSGTGAFGTGHIQVVDVATGDIVTEERFTDIEPTSLALSPDGTMLAVGLRVGQVTLRSFPTVETTVVDLEGFERPAFEVTQDRQVSTLAFSPGGRELIGVTAQGAVRRWSTDTGEVVPGGPLADHWPLLVLEDGRTIAGSASGAIVVFEGDQEVARAHGHTARIRALATGGGLLASGSDDGTVRLWDLRDLRPIASPFPVSSPVVDLSSDGRWLATAGRSVIRVWDLDPDSIVAAACDATGRNLTRQEWDRHLPDGIDYRVTCPQWPAAPEA